MNDTIRGLDLLRDVDVTLTVELGRARLALKDVLALGEDSVVPLLRQVDELFDVFVNGRLIARGEVVTEGNRFGLKIVELAGEQRALDRSTARTAERG
jgi:flagellar motor switch protein FliN/FliY